MTTTHSAISWFAGDDCQIDVTLLDETGAPFDLTGPPEIKWVLLDGNGQHVLDTADVAISIIDAAAGKCSIIIPAAKTSPLPGGRYTDVIRIVIGGVTSTLSVGVVNVAPDPWYVAVAAESESRRHLRRVS
jgi:hypothetical protein